MLSLLPSAATTAVATSSSAVDQRSNPGQSFYIKCSDSSSGSGLCSRSSSMGGNSGPTIPRIPPIIMPPLVTTSSNSTGEFSPPSPRLYPSPYSPAMMPYYAQGGNSTSSSSLSTTPAPHFYYPFVHPPNVYSRQLVQIDPNYPTMALATGLQNPSTRPYRSAPIYAVSPGNQSTSPSPTQYSVFPFPPPHHLSLHPSLNPYSTASPNEHSAIPLFGAPNNSPVRLTSISPDSHASVSPQSQVSHHSSSPGVVTKNVTIESTSTSSNVRPSTSGAGGSGSNGGSGRDISTKSRLLVRPGIGQNQEINQHHRPPKSVTYSNLNGSNSHYSPLPSSNVTITNVNKLRSATPKRQKSSSSSSSSSSIASATPRLPSASQPPTNSTVSAAESNNLPVQLIKDTTAGKNGGAVGGRGVKLMYPAHFNKGSIIQLTDGAMKCVEDLSTDDFVKSAEQSGNLQIDSSTVVRIEGNKNDTNGSTAILGFAVGMRKLQVSVEASLEHPFFVFGKGWSSCSPTRTLQRYSLSCHQLTVGDVCISLTHKENYQGKTSSSTTGQAIFSGERKREIAINNANNANSTIISTKVLTKVSTLEGGATTGAKRKRRWSESDAAECCVTLPANNSGHDNTNTILIQKPLNQS